MIKRRYTIIAAMVLTLSLLLSADLMAQRGRYYRGGYRGYYPRYAPVRAYAYNRPFLSVHFGGVPYRYQAGYFYRPFGTTVRVVVPPVGIVVSTLPPGYRRVYVGPNPYYYYNGVYYRHQSSRGYQVVSPPLGAEVDRLPPGAKVTVINGEKYYELNGTFYQELVAEDNQVVYVVVGTDGVLNTTTVDEVNGRMEVDEPEVAPPAITRQQTLPQVGDRLEALPSGAREVVIRGEKLYLSEAGYYYKEVVENGRSFYEVVGK